MKLIPGRYWIIFGAVLLVVLAFGSTYYFYNKLQGTEKLLANSNVNSQKEVEDLVKKVSRLIELPSGETPTVATVSDKDKLKSQTFFQNAENGDKVLIFTAIKKAILYRPTIDKLIEVAPVSLGGEQATAAAETKTVPIRVAIYNGTTIAGLAKSSGDNITGKFPEMTIVLKKDAVRKDYPKNLVVDLSGNFKSRLSELATFVNADISSLPEGEKKPDGDILVILGSSL